jgi:PPOX class probable FMN-dependent enzyme
VSVVNRAPDHARAHVDDHLDDAQVRGLYRSPHPNVVAKAIDHIDDAVRGFLEHSPLFVLATTSGREVDASPRGGPPGFVRVLDRARLAFGDLSGNNRIDSYRNMLEVPAVGMLFLIPGLDETLRVNGRGRFSIDPAIRNQCAIDGRVPKIAVVVDVDECFVHCAKAFRRGAVWDATTWPSTGERPSPAQMFNEHLSLGIDPAIIEADLEAGYQATLWEPGGA